VLSFGQYGVQLFFVISALTCVLTLQRAQRISEWYIRRATRIAVVYYFGLLFYFPIFTVEAALGVKDPSFSDPWNILANVLFVHGWVPTANNNVVPGGWSIAVEMTFYAVAPIVVALLAKPARAGVLLAGLGVGLLVLNEVVAGPVRNNSYTYFWPINQLPVFFLVVAAYAFSFCSGRNIWSSEVALPSVTAVGVGLVILGCWLGVYSGLSHVLAPSLVGLGSFIGLVGLGRCRRIFEWGGLTFLGRISFSLYIVHFAFQHVGLFLISRLPDSVAHFWAVWGLGMIVVCACSAVAASVLHHHVEARYVPISDWLIGQLKIRRGGRFA
jgi:peptidoglycan/LPS O-acetylase OafA/YrhL